MSNHKILNNATRCAKDILAVCEDMKNGKSEAEACRDHKIDVRKFRRFSTINYHTASANINKKDKEAYIEIALTSDEKLYRDIVLRYRTTHNYLNPDNGQLITSENLCESMKFVMDKYLTGDEQYLVRQVYYEKLTCAQIGKDLGVSRQCINSKLNKYLDKLATKECVDILTYGVDTYNQQMMAKNLKMKAYKTAKDSEVSQEIKDLTQQLMNIKSANDMNALIKLEEYIQTLKEAISANKPCEIVFDVNHGENIPILDELTSTRAKRCIHYNFEGRPITFVSDLQYVTKEQIKNTRGVGESILNEILAVADKYGIHIPEM